MWVKPSINGRLLGKSPGLRCGGQELNFTGTVSYRRGLGLPPNELEGSYLPNSDNGLRCSCFCFFALSNLFCKVSLQPSTNEEGDDDFLNNKILCYWWGSSKELFLVQHNRCIHVFLPQIFMHTCTIIWKIESQQGYTIHVSIHA